MMMRKPAMAELAVASVDMRDGRAKQENWSSELLSGKDSKESDKLGKRLANNGFVESDHSPGSRFQSNHASSVEVIHQLPSLPQLLVNTGIWTRPKACRCAESRCLIADLAEILRGIVCDIEGIFTSAVEYNVGKKVVVEYIILSVRCHSFFQPLCCDVTSIVRRENKDSG
jgi:hypothetical protein